jgi:hypothetical protein
MNRRVVCLLLALALFLRLGYVAATPGYQAIDDAHNYDVHAVSIAAGHGFARISSGPRGETAFRPPGYRTGIDPFIVMLASAALAAGWEASASRGRRVAGPARSAS